MFWRYNLITGSCIETLLDKENVTLKELMDEEDILQECKAQTKKLIDFLIEPEILNKTVSLILNEPDPEEDERQRYRYANRACELLTFDNPQVYDAIASDEGILKKLYDFLDTDESLNPLLASFFSKTMGLLIMKKTEAIFNYLKDTDFVNLMLKHLNTSAIMDLLLRFIAIENNDMRTTIIKWLNEQKLIQQLVSRIDLEYDEEFNCNASHSLCDIIKMSREHMSLLQEKADPNPLLEAIESVEVITDLLNHMLKDTRKEHAVVNGIPVLLSLLSFKKQGQSGIQQIPTSLGDQPLQADNAPSCFSVTSKMSETEQMTALDAERLRCGINDVLTAITPRLEDFHSLLLKPPVKPAIKLTIGCLDPPLGNCRLEIAHLITALLGTNNHSVNVKLTELKTIIVLMDMFFNYPWNNFLHSQVEQAIGRILINAPTVDKESNKVHPLLDQLFLQYKITVKVLECFQDDSEKCSPGKHRKGYMGHVTKIANHIAQCSENGVNSNLIKEKMKELPEDHQNKWEEFVSEKLAEINKKNRIYVISGPSVQSAASDEDSVDFREVPFGKDSSERLDFSDYRMHEITSNFVDQFGFNDDEFGDSEESLIYAKNALNPLSQNFQISEGNNMGRNEVFEDLCRSKVTPEFEDMFRSKINPESDAEIWTDRDQYNSSFSSCFRINRSVEENNSSDSDEESQVFEAENTPPIPLAPEEIKMEVDNHDAIFDGVPMEVAQAAISNPWGSSEACSSSDDQGNWADFSNFASFGSSTPASEDSDGVSSTVTVAMETSDPSSVKFFTTTSEISEAKAETSVSSEIISFSKFTEEKKTEILPDSTSDLQANSESVQSPKTVSEGEADSNVINPSSDEREKDSGSLFGEASSSSTAQNGPV
ncbi:serine/threonine-protein phosphatase 6 regulatory subunit 3 [Parasteatoda tepidariorum]|uniref:serine/threonine-protein phosphatase 6 regulatory subunit 3 n=1 Tax=Parasteatoda tepidariorum TaxID=114398 RepID=UPI00077F933E|nr:serine/threonine-protein phosphatase 6 regulatory subunit 3 [Parasteatoda tepidariorum]XP_015927662.1 serine/threonine-protein phosphatase 6 regulatory subunit 3 [Parasteatoda tepidariorum]